MYMSPPRGALCPERCLKTGPCTGEDLTAESEALSPIVFVLVVCDVCQCYVYGGFSRRCD